MSVTWPEFAELTKTPRKEAGLLEIRDALRNASLVLSGPDVQVLWCQNQPERLKSGKGSPLLQRWLQLHPTAELSYWVTTTVTGRELSTALNKYLKRRGEHFESLLPSNQTVDICLGVVSTGERFYCEKSSCTSLETKVSQLVHHWNLYDPLPSYGGRSQLKKLALTRRWTHSDITLKVIYSALPKHSGRSIIRRLTAEDHANGISCLKLGR